MTVQMVVITKQESGHSNPSGFECLTVLRRKSQAAFFFVPDSSTPRATSFLRKCVRQNVVVATSTMAANQDTFILGRITTDADGNSTMDVWLNPLLDTAPGEPGTGDLTITVEANDDGSATQFDTVGYRHQKWESPNLLDEIRMDEFFAAVVGDEQPPPVSEGTLLIVR